MKDLIDIALEKIIYEDVDVVFDSVMDAFAKILPDKSAHRQIDIDNAFKKAMRVKLYSLQMLFTRRRKYVPLSNNSKAFLSPQSTSKIVSDELSQTISEFSSFDAAIFLGSLVGIYIRICPKELFTRWAESTNGLISSNTFLMTEAMASHVAMMIDY